MLPDCSRRDFGRKMLRSNSLTGPAERDEPLDFVAQLPYLPGHQCCASSSSVSAVEKHIRLVEPLGHFPHEQAGEMGNLFAPVAQGE